MKTERKGGKKYWLGAVVTAFWWAVLGGVVFLVDPVVLADYPFPGTYGLFFVFLFLGAWFLASLLIANSRRGFLIAVGVVVLAYLQLWRLLSGINIVLLAGALAVFEYYHWKGERKTETHD